MVNLAFVPDSLVKTLNFENGISAAIKGHNLGAGAVMNVFAKVK